MASGREQTSSYCRHRGGVTGVRMDISYASGWLGIFTYRTAPACRLLLWYATPHRPFQNWKTAQHRASSSGSALHWWGVIDSSVSVR